MMAELQLGLSIGFCVGLIVGLVIYETVSNWFNGGDDGFGH